MRSRAWFLVAVMGLLVAALAGSSSARSLTPKAGNELSRGPHRAASMGVHVRYPMTPKTGTFHGTTSQGLPISFVVAEGYFPRSGEYFYVKRVSIRAQLTCEDLSTIDHTVVLRSGKGPKRSVTQIAMTGQVKIYFSTTVASGPWSFYVHMEGVFSKPKRAAGGLSVTILQTSRGRCDAQPVTWTATR